MESRVYATLALALGGFFSNLLISLGSTSFLNENDNFIVGLAVFTFVLAIGAIFYVFNEPDDEPIIKNPKLNHYLLIFGFALSIFDLIGVAVLVPSIFFIWGASGLKAMFN